jgi:hypothetical protein
MENLIMDQSSMPPKSDADQLSNSPVGRNGDANAGAKDATNASSQRMVADRLLAALSGGNLESLANARQAFLKQRTTEPKESVAAPKQRSAENKRFPADLEAELELRSMARSTNQMTVPGNDLRKEEEDLKKAEAELERRRAEIQAAKRKAEDDARCRAAEIARVQIEAEAHRRAVEEEQRLAKLEAMRKQAEDDAQKRSRREQQLNAWLLYTTPSPRDAHESRFPRRA